MALKKYRRHICTKRTTYIKRQGQYISPMLRMNAYGIYADYNTQTITLGTFN